MLFSIRTECTRREAAAAVCITAGLLLTRMSLKLREEDNEAGRLQPEGFCKTARRAFTVPTQM